MLIEQFIEFGLRRPGPPKFSNTFTRTCTPTTGYFYETTKIYEKNLVWIIIYSWNIARGNAPYFPVPGPCHLQNLTPKCKILNVFWT